MGKMAELDPEGEEYQRVSERFHALDTEFRQRDGYSLEAQAGRVLAGLGFPESDWRRRTEEFSGGWQMRIALAKLLLEKPNLLLLDEPTNHLDLEARNWLEEYLNNYPHAYVLISHDRFFLDVTVEKMVEIWNRRVHFYSGNYEKYLGEKTARRAQIEAAYKNQQERIEQLEVFINRFRYTATKAKQVQSRIKELERMERVEVPPEEKAIHFRFPQPKPSGRMVAEFKQVAKSYGAKRVFAGVNFTIQRGDRVALVGVNGAGKSTLLKLLAGLEPLSAGEYQQGHQVEVDYFAQDQYKALDADARLLDDLARAAPMALSTQTELRSLLGCFLFSEDEVFKRIGVLSGGERNRYALARMLVRPSNFLLLDEPTNHLDLRAKDVLLEALANYTGTVVFVSHDRYFIDKLATRVFEIAEGEVNVYPGNYEDYLWRKEGKEISLDVSGLEDLVRNRAFSRQTDDAGSTDSATEAAAAVKTKRAQSDPPATDERPLPRDRRAGGAPRGRDRRPGAGTCALPERRGFRALTRSIEQGRQELAGLMREWEETAKVVEEQEPRQVRPERTASTPMGGLAQTHAVWGLRCSEGTGFRCQASCGQGEILRSAQNDSGWAAPNAGTVVLSGAKDSAVVLNSPSAKSTAEILRCAQDDSTPQ